MIRRLCATSIVLVLATVSGAGQRQPANPRLDRLKQWMALVGQHQPGQVDAPVETVQLWTRDSLQDVRDDLYALRRLICVRHTTEANPRSACRPPEANARGAILSETTVAHRNRAESREWAGVYTVSHLAELGTLAAEVYRGNINDILKRGALLHTDIALRTMPMVTWSSRPIQAFLLRTTVRLVDGVQTGVDVSVDHLAMARRILDIVTPDPQHDQVTFPERDTTVRDWYRATMAVLLDGQGFFLTHEKAALELFREDDEVLFQAGTLHEAVAMPQYQKGVVTRRVANISVIESADAELRRAEELLRQALKINPNHLEARLRLGQVLGQRGRSADAVVELRKVEIQNTDPLLLYYASLFIGREEGVLNNVERARSAYQRAATLFPRAQSPHLGLSELAMRSGRRLEAARALDAVWESGGTSADTDDPWSNYPYAAGRTGNTLLDTIGAALRPLSAAP